MDQSKEARAQSVVTVLLLRYNLGFLVCPAVTDRPTHKLYLLLLGSDDRQAEQAGMHREHGDGGRRRYPPPQTPPLNDLIVSYRRRSHFYLQQIPHVDPN